MKDNEISIYSGDLTPENVAKTLVKLSAAFPQLEKGFFNVFSEAIKRNSFNDERLNDAVNFVIDNNIYPKPTVAQFISFDKKVKVYKYHEIVQLLPDVRFTDFVAIRLSSEQTKPVYVHQQDFEIVKYKRWNKEL